MKLNVSKTQTHDFAKSLLYPKTVTGILWRAITSGFGYFFDKKISQKLVPAQILTNDETFIRDTYTIEEQFNRKLSKPENSDVKAETHTVCTHDGAELETFELTHAEQETLAPDQQKYIIYLVGNGMCFQDIFKQLLDDCKALKYNTLSYNYRNVLRSTGEIHNKFDLISDLISQIERLRAQGIDLENIHLCGHSLGAGISTIVAHIYYKMGFNMKIFNGRSFTKFSDLVYYQHPEGWDRTIWGTLDKLKFTLTDLDIDALSAYLEIPEESKCYITVESNKSESRSVEDGVIARPASLHFGLTTHHQRPKDLHPDPNDELRLYHGTKVISTNNLAGYGHNDPIETLTCKDSKENAQEYYRKFFSTSYRQK